MRFYHKWRKTPSWGGEIPMKRPNSFDEEFVKGESSGKNFGNISPTRRLRCFSSRRRFPVSHFAKIRKFMWNVRETLETVRDILSQMDLFCLIQKIEFILYSTMRIRLPIFRDTSKPGLRIWHIFQWSFSLSLLLFEGITVNYISHAVFVCISNWYADTN